MFFSTLYTSLPYNLIKDERIDLIERIFYLKGSPYFVCYYRNAFFTLVNPIKYHAWSCKNVYDALRFCWTTFIYDLALNCIGK